MPTLQSASISIMAPPNPHLRDNPQRLKEVDEHIEHLRNALKYFEEERIRLTAIPADAHPVGVPEVLGYIMEWGVHMDAFEPETLLQVSRHWHHVALNTPGVWARIVRKPTYLGSFTQFLHKCRKYLERSKKHPLLIDVDFLYFLFESSSPAVYTQFAELVQPHLHRCYHISLANPRESLAHLFSSLSPDVEHIAHYCANATHRGAPLALPPVLPRLRHLSGTFPLPIFANIDMPALEHLQIALSPVNPTFHELLFILQRCPNLKCLLFDNVSFTLAVEPDLTSVKVPLLELKRLEFHCSGTADATLLTSHCILPNLQELCITGNMLPIPLDLFRNITTLHCSDWDFPWFVRALRVATQLETLTVRSHGADSPFHTELLPALSSMASPSTSSLSNLAGAAAANSSGTLLVPKLHTLHLSALTYSDFPIDAFLTFLRKRSSSFSAQTIRKIVLEDVSHVTDFTIEQLKSEVEEVEVIKTNPSPITFPFFPTAVGRGGGIGVAGNESPAAVMHPIVLPPVAYGAPLIPPPPVVEGGAGAPGGPAGVGEDRTRNGDGMALLTFRTRSGSPRANRRRRRDRSHTTDRSPIIVSAPSRIERSRSPSPAFAQSRRRRSRSFTSVRDMPETIHPAGFLNYHRSRSPSISSRSRSRSPSPEVYSRRSFSRHTGSPVAPTLVLESGQSQSARSQSLSTRLRIMDRSTGPSPVGAIGRAQLPSSSDMDVPEDLDVELIDHDEEDEGEMEFIPAPEMLHQSEIIIHSPSSSFSVSPRRPSRRSLTHMDDEDITSPRLHMLPPSTSSSRSSTARSTSEGSEGRGRSSRSHNRSSRSRSPSPYPFDQPVVGGDRARSSDLDTFGRVPLRRPIQATVSASTDSTLPTGRDQTARELASEHGHSMPVGPRNELRMTPTWQRHVRSGSKRGRSGSVGNSNDLRLFVPMAMPPSQLPMHSAALPLRAHYGPPGPVGMSLGNNADRETQRTSITIAQSPRLVGTDPGPKVEDAPRRRSSIWSRLKSLVK
ncbi:hypothetical protein CPB86DRAFT_260090 [Serendipita vermifera]|nr:hypothetical protein CPB86DRAFT_260090 [Serendipita vermifera]